MLFPSIEFSFQWKVYFLLLSSSSSQRTTHFCVYAHVEESEMPIKSTFEGETNGSKSSNENAGERKKKKCILCVFGIQHCFFENPISRFMFACCNRFVINESFSFPISYRLIFNKFSVRLEASRCCEGSCLADFLFNISFEAMSSSCFTLKHSLMFHFACAKCLCHQARAKICDERMPKHWTNPP